MDFLNSSLDPKLGFFNVSRRIHSFKRSTKKRKDGVMKIWKFLRTVVNGFGEVDILLTVWTSTDAQSKSLFSIIFKVF